MLRQRFEGRTLINEMDIAHAAELALPHRMKRGPFEKEIASMEELSDRIEELKRWSCFNRISAKNLVKIPRQAKARRKKKLNRGGTTTEIPEMGEAVPDPGAVFQQNQSNWWEGSTDQTWQHS